MRQSCACGGRIHPLEVRPLDCQTAHFRCDKCGKTFRQGRRGPPSGVRFMKASITEENLKDPEFMREVGNLLTTILPATHAFILLAVPRVDATADRTYYLSNADPASAIPALQEWLLKAGQPPDTKIL